MCKFLSKSRQNPLNMQRIVPHGFVLGFSTIVAPALNFGFIFKLICIRDTDKVHGWLQRQLDYGVSAGTKAKQPNLGLKIYNNGDRNYSSGSKNDKRA